MILQLAPISSAILSLAWQGQTGFTYTIQTSTDLENWETLPYVVEGQGLDESYFLEIDPSRSFIRLAYDTDGDTDDNNLPDMWEWQYFGQLGTDPSADPDLDGVTTYKEWLGNTHPLDYFDEEWPIIHIACGKDWLVPTGELSTNGVCLYLRKPSGEPWANAPVTLSMSSGESAIEVIGSSISAPSDHLVVWTDSMGRIDSSIQSIHIRASQIAGTIDHLVIGAGKAHSEIRIHSIGESFGPPPRNLEQYVNEKGQMVYSWTGDPGEATSFLLEQKNYTGEWIEIIEIATTDLSAPDPLDGSYLLTIKK